MPSSATGPLRGAQGCHHAGMHCHREGTGEPLVLIHGVGHHGQAWRPVIDRLSGAYDVRACDSPGFGRSQPLPDGTEPTVAAYTDAFQQFFRDQGLQHPHVAGNSLGGAVALELAKRGAVASATAVSPAGFWTPGERRYALISLLAVARVPRAVRPYAIRAARTVPGRAALFAQLVGNPAALPPEEAAETLGDLWASSAFVPALHALQRYAFTGGAELGPDVSVGWGDKDRLLLYGRQAPRARAALPKARHVTLNGGHVPFFDDPDGVADLIRSTTGV